MIIKYNKFDEYTRNRIRFLENKGHIGYIRYLMLRRIPFTTISTELLSLGLSGADPVDYQLYFKNVMYPLLRDYKIANYYKNYLNDKEKERFSFDKTLSKSESHRKYFCECIKELEVDCFFSNEIHAFYRTKDNIPLSDKTGEPVISSEKMPDWTEMLNHPKRHVIDGMLVDGKTPAMISAYLDKTYDIQLPAGDIAQYGKVFFKTRRRDLERTIEDLENEKAKLQEGLDVIKKTSEDVMTIGEKTTATANIKQKISMLDAQIKRLSSHHSNAAFNEGVLEFANMREMFADVMIRSHKRFQMLDEKTEVEIVNPLNTVVSMMSRASDKIMSLEAAIKESTKRSVVDEMLEVVMPSLDRLEDEERRAREEYETTYGTKLKEDEEILGLDEE